MDTSYFSPTAKQALQLFNQSNFSQAAQQFLNAAEEYTQSNQPLLAAEMKNNASVAFLQAGEASQALACLDGVVEQFETAQDDYKAGLTHGNLATAYLEQKDFDAAETHCYQAADLLRNSNHHDEYTMIMNLLVTIQMKKGKIFDAAGSAHLYVDQIPHPTFRQRVLKIVYKIYKFLTRLFTK